MKKISMILSFALFSIAFTACKKEESKFCATCKVTTTTTSSDGADIPVDVDMEMEQCDMTQSQLDEMMKSGTYTTTTKSGDVTLTMKMVMSCEKK
ncbi:hypothetical protein ABDJ41_12605 [Pedobacter sp. ASV1-7]|jgi:hypothetical protein|uniref:hypothetical protein n=1 Tax=Pedobacter sp. ASV1-7 TaxID=3145237 RepID=UPI0032E89EBC